MATVSVSVIAETQFGDRVVIVGSTGALGAWEPCKGIDVFTDALTYPVWSGSVSLSHDDFDAFQRGILEFKFVVLKPNGTPLWEPGANRRTKADCVRQLAAPMRFGDTNFIQVCVCENEVKTCDVSRQGKGEVAFAFDGADRLCTAKADDLASPSTSAGTTPRTCESRQVSTKIPDRGKGLKLRSGAHRVKKMGGVACEDAYCLGTHFLGVADGVSSMSDFASEGVDAAAFASELMEIAEQTICEHDPLSEANGTASARAAAAIAAAETKASTYGASTITVLTMSGDTAGVASLGDSGFMLLRAKPWGMQIIQRSVEQQHCWNCPYQLTRIPSSLSEKFKSSKFDSAGDSQRYDVTVKEGDLLVLYTDGFSDNLFPFEIVKSINEAIAADASSTPPKKIAEALVLAAQERSKDATAETPFSVAARRRRKRVIGGKVDDITVVTAWVTR